MPNFKSHMCSFQLVECRLSFYSVAAALLSITSFFSYAPVGISIHVKVRNRSMNSHRNEILRWLVIGQHILNKRTEHTKCRCIEMADESPEQC